MKCLAVILVSISILSLVHSSQKETKLLNTEQKSETKLDKKIPHIMHRVVKHVAARPTIKAPRVRIAKPPAPVVKPPAVHCKALEGCIKGSCSVNVGNKKPLTCHCSACAPNTYNLVCITKKQCHCEKSCPPVPKPAGCLKSEKTHTFVSHWGHHKWKSNYHTCENHAKCACWNEYELNCKQNQCKRTSNFHKCVANLKKSIQMPAVFTPHTPRVIKPAVSAAHPPARTAHAPAVHVAAAHPTVGHPAPLNNRRIV